MLRITDLPETTSDGLSTRTLVVEGTLTGPWLMELRRAWQRVREAGVRDQIRVHLADVRFVDAAGKVLLAEMYRDGVDIVARGSFGMGIRDEIIAACATDRAH